MKEPLEELVERMKCLNGVLGNSGEEVEKALL